MDAAFKYFRAPLDEVNWFSDQEPCIHCGEVAPATEVESGSDDGTGKYCCLPCLSKGKTLLSHETELGFLEDGVVSQFDIEKLDFAPIELPSKFLAESLHELARNPSFKSHQGQGYLIHCDDFMRYIGRWEPENFERLGEESGRDAYIKMADGDPQLWDETEQEKARREDSWAGYVNSNWAYGSWCYVFECIHCAQRRCTWDCE